MNEITLSGNFQSDRDEAILNWQVVNSSNVDRFEVQRSGDGMVYTSIGRVYPPASGSALSYTFVDNNLPANQNFLYRIVGMSVTQPDAYSNIIEVQTADPGSRTISVSQTSGQLYVNTNTVSAPAAFEIVSLSGQVLIKGVAPSTTRFQVDVQRLAHGIYVIHLREADQTWAIEFLR